MNQSDFIKKFPTVTEADIKSLLTDESKPLVEAAEKAVRDQIGESLKGYLTELGTDLKVDVVREQTDSELAKQVADLNKQIKATEAQVTTATTDKAKLEADITALKTKHAALEGDVTNRKRREEVRAELETLLKDSDYREQIVKTATEGDLAPINDSAFDKAKAKAFVESKTKEYDTLLEGHSGNRLGEVETKEDDLYDHDGDAPATRQNESVKPKKGEKAYAV